MKTLNDKSKEIISQLKDQLENRTRKSVFESESEKSARIIVPQY